MAHDTDRVNVDEIVTKWQHGLVEVTPGSNAHKLLTALAAALDDYDTSLSNVTDAHHLGNAEGDELERIGKLGDVQRKTGESDGKYRERIRGNIRASTSSGTFDDVLEFAVTMFDTSENNVRLDTDFDLDPAVVTVSIFQEDLNDSPLTASEVKDLFNDVVAAGHEAKVNERGTFEVKADGTSDDADKGLTSDSVSTGGTLAADL